MLLRGGELQVDLPLQILAKHDGAPVFFAGMLRFRAMPDREKTAASPSIARSPGCAGGPIHRARNMWRSAAGVLPAFDVLLKLPRPGGAAPVIAAQECRKKQLQNLIFNALTRSYSTNSDARSASISCCVRAGRAVAEACGHCSKIGNALDIEVKVVAVEDGVGR